MDYKYIEQLLERYFEAQTTLHEEQILRAFFAQEYEEIPSQLRSYKCLFDALQPECGLPEDFGEHMLQLTEDSVMVKARVISMADRLRPLLKAVAIVAVVLTLSNALNQSFKSTDVWTDQEQVAGYQAAIRQRALAAASEDSLMLLSEGLAGRMDSLVVDSLYGPTGYLE